MNIFIFKWIVINNLSNSQIIHVSHVVSLSRYYRIDNRKYFINSDLNIKNIFLSKQIFFLHYKVCFMVGILCLMFAEI